MAAPDLHRWLEPLQGPAPCGTDLAYDPVFQALELAGAGRPEQQFDQTVIAAEPPDWATVQEHAQALAERTRDLRVAVWLLRSGARLSGWPAALAGLQLLQGLLAQHWAQVHPQIDPHDGDDTERLNALAPLVHAEAGLADLRAAALTGTRGGPRLRDVELAFGGAEPARGETAPAREGLLQTLAAQPDAQALAQSLQAGLASAQAIVALLAQHVGPARGPDFTPLLRLLKPVAALGAELLNGSAAAMPQAATAATPGAAPAPATGEPASRADVQRMLQRARTWIEQNEPASPAPILIRRAERLIGKSFIEIMRDLVPDGVREVEKLAGPSGDT